MKKLTEEWLRAARDDLDVIERILNDEHLTHIAGLEAAFQYSLGHWRKNRA